MKDAMTDGSQVAVLVVEKAASWAWNKAEWMDD